EDACSPAFCSFTGPEVRFPFSLVDRKPSSCGFPGFDLSCNEKNQTILKLPSSRSSIVVHISYDTQVIRVDPDFCGPERLVGIKLPGTLFEDSRFESYTFYNCSSPNASFNVPNISFPCLGSVNHSVYALETWKSSNGDIPESCKDIATVSVPVLKQYGGIVSSTLRWIWPYCETCELGGGTCAFKDGKTTCTGSSNG
nr:zinc finger, RING/FYVE/PHD-type [Tanacetum cinerariifolium]